MRSGVRLAARDNLNQRQKIASLEACTLMGVNHAKLNVFQAFMHKLIQLRSAHHVSPADKVAF
ncbi:hypothetical protein PR002_g15645 [Phytophthora rubi]|uniref:Uncharacterized protein n=1 Tax=Phytophthora rubi TaxID=129364 RepID=A0A6A3KUY5_9STRA|nr:hypothetical protein PR002_g15645 [Phytophthora rubi]